MIMVEIKDNDAGTYDVVAHSAVVRNVSIEVAIMVREMAIQVYNKGKRDLAADVKKSLNIKD